VISDSRLAVMHAVRVKGVATDEAITQSTGLPADVVAETLAHLSRSGEAVHRDGRAPGWRLTAEGKTRHQHDLAAALQEADLTPVIAFHSAFTELNNRFKETCTRWQLRGEALNDHTDGEYDSSVIAQVGAIHVALAEACAVALELTSSYLRRFEHAFGRLSSGDNDALARPLSGSYHDVWMELHQDLILRLGLSRGDDDA
jgi:DNA-binding IscR family transcriptional regulator